MNKVYIYTVMFVGGESIQVIASCHEHAQEIAINTYESHGMIIPTIKKIVRNQEV